MAPPSDAELMSRTRAGDREAFGELVDRHKDVMVNYLTRLTGSRERAEDVAQEAFLRLYRHAPRYQEQGQLAAYLFRIATNLVRSEERKARRWRIISSVFSSNGHHGGTDPQAALLGAEAAERLAGALASLPLHFRSALVLREVEELPYQEIARITGCREGTVKSRINRGRELLRRQLTPYVNGGLG